MKITKQKVQSVADLKAGYTLGHADVAMLKAMARQLLSGLDQEPVATFYKSECGNVFNTLDGWLPVEGVNNLYAAPQLPQSAVLSVYDGVLKSLLPDAEKPDFWFEHNGKIFFEGVKFNDAVFEACRAAMLHGDEPVTDNTNQQFESLSRGDK